MKRILLMAIASILISFEGPVNYRITETGTTEIVKPNVDVFYPSPFSSYI